LRRASAPGIGRLARCAAFERAAGLEHADFEKLPRVVPLVQRVRDVQTLVALEAYELGLQRLGQRLGNLGLADAGFALEKERTAQLEREVNGQRERAVGDVALAREQALEVLDGRGLAHYAARAARSKAVVSA